MKLQPLRSGANHVAALKALAHEGRLQVFFSLVSARGELQPQELQEKLDVPGPTLSHHLDSLRQAGLIEQRRDGRNLFYSVNRAMVSDLVRLLTACC